MRVKNEDLLSATGPISMASSFQLPAVWLGHICNYSIQLVFTGTPSGTFKLQCSNDPGNTLMVSDPLTANSIVNWTDIAGSSQAVAAAGNHVWQVENAGYNWVRVVYTASAGTGTLTSARCYVKGI